MRTVLAYLLLLVLVPVTAWILTLGFARLTGRLMRWRDAQGRAQGFDIRVGSPRFEFAIAFVRGLLVAVGAIALFLIMRVAPGLPLVATVIVLLAAWHIWVLRSHRRMWRSFETVIHAQAYGDVGGAVLGGLLVLALLI